MGVDPTGRTFFPLLNLEFWATIRPLLQRQVVQLSADELEVRYVAERDLDAAECTRITEALRRAMAYEFRIGFARVPEIPHGPGHKYHDFMTLVDLERYGAM